MHQKQIVYAKWSIGIIKYGFECLSIETRKTDRERVNKSK